MSMTTEEKIKIINDNPCLWLKNFIKIVDNHSNLIPFKVNDQQKEIIDEMYCKNIKFSIIGKSRQIGATTLSLGLMLYTAITKPNSNCLLLNYSGGSCASAFTKLQQMYESIPKQYNVKARKMNRSEILLENGSRINNAVASNKLNSLRGVTYNFIHITEFAFFNNDIDTLLSVEQALSKDSSSKVLIESTANGCGNYYYQLFTNAYRRRSKYYAFFFPWYANKEQFKDEYKEAESWYKGINHGNRLQAKFLSPFERELHNKGANLLQIMWREWKLLDMPEKMFKQEFPSTPEEMFQSNDIGVFDADTITERYNYLPKILNINQIKPLPNSLNVYYGNGFSIYKDVNKNERYYIGIDISAGLKQDYSSITVLDSSGEQIATFNRNDIPVYKFAKICYDIGLYYNYALMLPERNSYGLDLLTRLRKEMGYINILKQKKFDKIKGTRSWEYGFFTDNVSKTKLISDLKESFETGIILINDVTTLDQMRIYVERNGSYNNIRGNNNHDDLVISLALAVQALKSGKSYV